MQQAAPTPGAISFDDVISTRRTVKVFEDEPLSDEELESILAVAGWTPNHHLTNPWSFHVIGPETLAQLKLIADAAKPGSSRKLERARTLVAVTTMVDDDPVTAEEDLLSSAAATYGVLLAAHARGFASYWRSAGIVATDAGRRAVGIADDERCIGILYLGRHRADRRLPERSPLPVRVVRTL